MELVVKRPLGLFAPAQWFHARDTNALLGQQVRLRAGGTFSYDPATDGHLSSGGHRHIVLVAGGIGISPLRSVALTIRHWLRSTGSHAKVTVSVVYAASTPAELVFAHDFEQMREEFAGRVEVVLAVDEERADSWPWAETWDPVTVEQGQPHTQPMVGRVNEEILRQAMGQRPVDETLVLVCGPPPMTDNVVDMCTAIGLPTSSVLFEKWW